jgi:hypothetical protein
VGVAVSVLFLVVVLLVVVVVVLSARGSRELSSMGRVELN